MERAGREPAAVWHQGSPGTSAPDFISTHGVHPIPWWGAQLWGSSTGSLQHHRANSIWLLSNWRSLARAGGEGVSQGPVPVQGGGPGRQGAGRTPGSHPTDKKQGGQVVVSATSSGLFPVAAALAATAAENQGPEPTAASPTRAPRARPRLGKGNRCSRGAPPRRCALPAALGVGWIWQGRQERSSPAASEGLRSGARLGLCLVWPQSQW